MRRKQKEPAKRGPKSKYDARYHPMAAKKLAAQGLVLAQIADFFDITEPTIYEWKKIYPEFAEAIEEGKADPIKQVENALFKASIGHNVKVKKPVVVGDGEGVAHVEYCDYEEYHAPVVSAQKYFLNNRASDKWKEKHEITLDNESKPLVLEIISDRKSV